MLTFFSFPLPRPPLSSHILVVVSCPQQRFNLDRLVIFKVRPEKVQPVAVLRLYHAEEVALEEVDKVFEWSAIKRRFSTFGNEMTISVG